MIRSPSHCVKCLSLKKTKPRCEAEGDGARQAVDDVPVLGELSLVDAKEIGRKSQALHLVRALSGFTVMPAAESGDKLTRFGPFSSQCRAGNVKIRRARWNEDLFRALEGFPDLAHDDEVDACSGALEMLHPENGGLGLL
jgi:predicted phage terminase large subunit-like protein